MSTTTDSRYDDFGAIRSSSRRHNAQILGRGLVMSESTCPVCFSAPEQFREELDRDRCYLICPWCGTFSVTRTAEGMLRFEIDRSEAGKLRLGPRGDRRRANASAWLRANQNREWQEDPLTSDEIEKLASLPTPTVLERADKLLLALDKETTFVGERHDLEEASWWAASWCEDATETENLARLMQSMGWIESVAASASAFPVMISAGGWQRLEDLRRRGAGSEQGFVAMSFSGEMRPIYENALAPAITDAGYHPHRVDRREFEGKIDDEIVAQIRRSRFVIADFTGHRYGVYWEAGFGAGLGLPVFLTCRKDEMEKLHFDVRQYNCIDWETGEGLRERLAKRIEAVLGRGPAVRPATS